MLKQDRGLTVASLLSTKGKAEVIEGLSNSLLVTIRMETSK
jgi:hypothetical protein